MKLRNLFITGSILLAGCTDDPIYDTPHPDTGQISFAMEWSQRTDGIAIPSALTATANTYSAQIPGQAGGAFPNLLIPGDYRLSLWNAADKIAMTGATAAVAAVTAPAGASGTFIDPLPGWLFSWNAVRKIEKDKNYDIIAAMSQQVRRLTLVIEPTGETSNSITSVSATLSGVAGSLGLDNGTHGSVSNVAIAFTKIAAGADAGKYTATVRLLGIAGTQQKLSVTIAFTDDTPAPVTSDHDLSALLSSFNTDKKTPLTLGSQVVETPAGSGFTAIITDWTPIIGGSGDAD